MENGKLAEYDFSGPQPIYYRPNSYDAHIINANFIDKSEYSFPKMNPKVILDIGANIGVISVLMANLYPNAQILAFEPVEENYELLLKNIEKYPNIKPFKCALGYVTEEKDIYASENELNLGGFSFFPDGTDPNRVSRVQVRNVNDILDSLGIENVDIIKIDTEGAEHEILMSLREERLKNVKWIAGELHGNKDFQLLEELDKHFLLAIKKPFKPRNYQFHAASKRESFNG